MSDASSTTRAGDPPSSSAVNLVPSSSAPTSQSPSLSEQMKQNFKDTFTGWKKYNGKGIDPEAGNVRSKAYTMSGMGPGAGFSK